MKISKRAAATGALAITLALFTGVAAANAATSYSVSGRMSTDQYIQYETFRYHSSGAIKMTVTKIPPCGGQFRAGLRLKSGIQTTNSLVWGLEGKAVGTAQYFRTASTASTVIPTGYYALNIRTAYGFCSVNDYTAPWAATLVM